MSPFLHRCQCARGFFVLRPCDADAPHTCARCARQVCHQHWSTKVTPPACHECVARIDEDRAIDGDDFDSAWFHRYRHRYYTTSHYRPIYDGGPIDPYYNRYDAWLLGPSPGPDPDPDGADDNQTRGLDDS